MKRSEAKVGSGAGRILLLLLGVLLGAGLILSGFLLGDLGERTRAAAHPQRSATPAAPRGTARGLDLPARRLFGPALAQRRARGLDLPPARRAPREDRRVQELRAAQSERAVLEKQIEEMAAQIAALEARQGELLERALSAELQAREQITALAKLGAQPRAKELGGAGSAASKPAEETARGERSEPLPGASSSFAEILDSVRAGAAEGGAEPPASAASEEQQKAPEAGALQGFCLAFNQRLAADGYGDQRLISLGGLGSGELREALFLFEQPGGGNRLLYGERARFAAYPRLRSLRLELIGGYEQRGGGDPVPFASGRAELSWADLSYGDWKTLLAPLGALREIGAEAGAKVDEGFEPALVRTRLNTLLERTGGRRTFNFKRLDAVLVGPRLGGVILHQLAGADLEVIYEAEGARLDLHPDRKLLEIILENGFQRRGLERIPFFEQRARIFVRLDNLQGWDPAAVPIRKLLDAAKGAN